MIPKASLEDGSLRLTGLFGSAPCLIKKMIMRTSSLAAAAVMGGQGSFGDPFTFAPAAKTASNLMFPVNTPSNKAFVKVRGKHSYRGVHRMKSGNNVQMSTGGGERRVGWSTG